MYSNKENVNILTALLACHGIRTAVVCPGSRNAPIVHNLNECPLITCYAVTDERSAGFYALGMAQVLAMPVAVCVTSGTALLNLSPAVAEAYYQHLPLIVISADRPEAWIGQLDGQTMPQKDAFGRFVCKAVSLPEPQNNDDRWLCNRLVNEALLASMHRGGGPVHINVPIGKPLFEFTTSELPRQRVIKRIESVADTGAMGDVVRAFSRALRPMIVIGQQDRAAADACEEPLVELQSLLPVLYECLGMPSSSLLDLHIEGALDLIKGNEEPYLPDFVLYMGDALISNRLKRFLRKGRGMEVWAVSPDGDIHDTFMAQTGVIEGKSWEVLSVIRTALQSDKSICPHQEQRVFLERWKTVLDKAYLHAHNTASPFSERGALECFFDELYLHTSIDYELQAGNSMAVRLVNEFAEEHVCCNRGVNGIEGSLSTAAGMSVVSGRIVFCVIGDLSFFYDQNALWNGNLRGNLRVLLLNNGRGGIFDRLPHLDESAAKEPYVVGAHHTSARGICMQNSVTYLRAGSYKEMDEALKTFMQPAADRPIVLEISLGE